VLVLVVVMVVVEIVTSVHDRMGGLLKLCFLWDRVSLWFNVFVMRGVCV